MILSATTSGLFPGSAGLGGQAPDAAQAAFNPACNSYIISGSD
ncbi:MAG: hypothetical protein WCD20_08500 [Rhodomicrobium sp.]